MDVTDHEIPVHDVVGVGFGPSNLALAAALDDECRARPGAALSARFFERQARFGWHIGMLIEGATMQVSFLKDLVTMRDPTSRYSFVSYLAEQGRLADFINHKVLFPSRVEFADYLRWAADQLESFVAYGAEVVDVRPVHSAVGTDVELLDVVVAHCREVEAPAMETVRTRNLVVATGLVPAMPVGIAPGERTWHSSEFLTRLAELGDGGGLSRVVVLGAGQSAAEVTEHLHARFRCTEVFAVLGKYGYCPADDSPFVNQIFDPGAVDEYYGAGPDTRCRLMADHRATNYSVVDLELIEELYRRQYQEKVLGEERLHTLRSSEVTRAVEHGAGVDVDVRSRLTGATRSLRADLVVCATGYRAGDPCRLLGDVAGRCQVDGSGLLALRRDYRVVTDDGVHAGLYVQGATEHTHGIGSTLLSNTAVRAGEILSSLLARAGSTDPTPTNAPRRIAEETRTR